MTMIARDPMRRRSLVLPINEKSRKTTRFVHQVLHLTYIVIVTKSLLNSSPYCPGDKGKFVNMVWPRKCWRSCNVVMKTSAKPIKKMT